MDIDDTKVIDSFGDYERSRVLVMLYNDLSQKDFAYEKLSDPDNFFDTAVISPADAGEKSVSIKVPSIITADYEYVIFTRCASLVFIYTTDNTINYAQRLDERLTPLVCR